MQNELGGFASTLRAIRPPQSEALRPYLGTTSKASRLALQALLGTIAVAAVTAIAFRFELRLAAPLCLDLIVVVLLSLCGDFIASAFVSVIAVGCLDYYFTQPLYSPLIFDPIDVYAILLFLITAGVITTLVSRLRAHSTELTMTTARLEEQIVEAKRAQDQLNLARVNRVMLMGEMTASIAHEINQPLTGILANGGTALRYLNRAAPDLEEVRKFLGLIVRDGKRAAEVTARVRALAKKASPRAIPIDLNATVRDVVALVDLDLKAKHAVLQADLRPNLPAVRADRIQLQQVMLNLIVNAIEAMKEVDDRPREVFVVSGTEADGEVFIEVRDCGSGIDPAHIDKLFTSFFTTKDEGLGMGLSISRSIVEAHGGRLWAMPGDPHGAVFRFVLPTDRSDT